MRFKVERSIFPLTASSNSYRKPLLGATSTHVGLLFKQFEANFIMFHLVSG